MPDEQESKGEVSRVWKFLFWALTPVCAFVVYLVKDNQMFYKHQFELGQKDLRECTMSKYQEKIKDSEKYEKKLQEQQDYFKGQLAKLDSVLANQSRGSQERERILDNQDYMKQRLK